MATAVTNASLDKLGVVSTNSLEKVDAVVPVPLDLVDVRKTQRRLKALLRGFSDVKIVDTSRPVIRRRPIPNGFCYVCNGIDELGKYKNPHTHLFSKGFFKHCEHQPRTPFPTVDDIDGFTFDEGFDGRHGSLDFNRENSDLNFEFKVSVKAKPSEDPDKYAKKYFDTAVLKRGKYDDSEFDDHVYKLPPVFDSGYQSNSTERDSGKLVPRVGERTFDEAGRYEDDQSGDEGSTHDDSNSLPLLKRRKSNQEHDEGYHETRSEKSEVRTHSEKSESRSTNSKTRMRKEDFDKSNESMSVSEAGSSRSDGNVIKEVATANSPEMSMIIQRVSTSPHWCTCADPSIPKSKCPDCHQLVGHEKWCKRVKSPTKQCICVKCGKPIKFTPDRHPSRSTSFSFECESRHSSPVKRGTEIRQRSPVKTQKKEPHVHFEDKPGIKELTLERDATDEDFLDIHDVIYDESGKIWVPTEEFDRDFETRDPNIHREAYLKALRAVRTQKLKKVVEIDEKFIRDRITRPFVFSYFKLLPAQKNALPDGPRDIGIKPDNSKGIPPRKAMKHIFNKVNVSDYYPGGKGNPTPGPLSLSLQEEKHRQTMPIHKLKWKNR